MQEALFLDGGRDLSSEAALELRLVGDHAAASLLYGVDHGFNVPGLDRAEVDELAADAGMLGRGYGHPDGAHLDAIADDGNV